MRNNTSFLWPHRGSGTLLEISAVAMHAETALLTRALSPAALLAWALSRPRCVARRLDVVVARIGGADAPLCGYVAVRVPRRPPRGRSAAAAALAACARRGLVPWVCAEVLRVGVAVAAAEAVGCSAADAGAGPELPLSAPGVRDAPPLEGGDPFVVLVAASLQAYMDRAYFGRGKWGPIFSGGLCPIDYGATLGGGCGGDAAMCLGANVQAAACVRRRGYSLLTVNNEPPPPLTPHHVTPPPTHVIHHITLPRAGTRRAAASPRSTSTLSAARWGCR